MKATPEQICDDIMRLLQHVKVTAFALAEKEDLTRMQWFVLITLYQQGELGMGQVADMLHCDASNITGIVDRLMASDLVLREESRRDRRAKTLRLTPKGSALTQKIRSAMPEKLGYNKLTSEENEALHAILQKLCP